MIEPTLPLRPGRDAMTHYLDKCKHGVVVRQCRCPGPKTVNVVPCPPMCPSEPTYLCDQCGKPRTKAEGGTVQPGTGSNLPWVGGEYVSLSHVREDEDLAEENAKLRKALERLRDCDWVISLPDRMDVVREIAREALK